METYPPVPSRTWASIDKEAQIVFRRLFPNLDNFFKPQAMLWVFEGGLMDDFNIGYGVESLPFGEDGKFNFVTNEIILDEEVYNALVLDDGRARFTVAHEIGHGLLHGGYMKASSGRVPTMKRSSIPAYMDPECQANRFASEFLLPSPLVLGHLQRGDSLTQVSRHFRTSHTATRIKCEELIKSNKF